MERESVRSRLSVGGTCKVSITRSEEGGRGGGRAAIDAGCCRSAATGIRPSPELGRTSKKSGDSESNFDGGGAGEETRSVV